MKTSTLALAGLACFAGFGALGGYGARRAQQSEIANEDSADDVSAEPTIGDQVEEAYSAAKHLVTGSPASSMQPTDMLADMLKKGEGLRLTRYRLGDGGWTLGYGRYFADGGNPPPESIDLQTAEDWFAEDLEKRGARWVRAYVEVPVQQWEFDALTSMAYNLSPKSFSTIAAAVNRGEDPEAAALKFVRAGTNLERGLRLRRGREMDLYRDGVYA